MRLSGSVLHRHATSLVIFLDLADVLTVFLINPDFSKYSKVRELQVFPFGRHPEKLYIAFHYLAANTTLAKRDDDSTIKQETTRRLLGAHRRGGAS